MNLCLCYLDVVADHDSKLLKDYMDRIAARISEHGTFLELYCPDASVYRRAFYTADEGMLWAAKFVALREKIR